MPPPLGLRRRARAPRAAIPKGAFDLRFRGPSSGKGANFTLRSGADSEEVDADAEGEADGDADADADAVVYVLVDEAS